MPYIPPSVVQEVKRMDLLTYLKNYEPYELVHFSGNTYTTRTHDSLKISNGKWMWWSQRTGGRSALDYLIKVRGYSFLEAVELLAERANIQPPLFVSENVPMEKQVLLPKKNQDDQKVIAYLSGRGIDKEIIQFCLESGRVYESAFHHNAVFVGMDGFGGRVEWCACFVSWCADQSGYIQSGVIPKFSLCSDGVKWFESKGRFRDGSYTPVAGDIIFFDWGNNGTIDHVGIVESVSGGTVNTIEGNSGDKVARRSYRIGSSNIYGYGVPAY